MQLEKKVGGSLPASKLLVALFRLLCEQWEYNSQLALLLDRQGKGIGREVQLISKPK